MCFSDYSFSVHIRRSDQFEADKFQANYVTPQLLQEVFELESLPRFLKKESDSEIVPIIPSALNKNDFYIIKGPGKVVEGEMKKLKDLATRQSGATLQIFIGRKLYWLMEILMSFQLPANTLAYKGNSFSPYG